MQYRWTQLGTMSRDTTLTTCDEFFKRVSLKSLQSRHAFVPNKKLATNDPEYREISYRSEKQSIREVGLVLELFEFDSEMDERYHTKQQQSRQLDSAFEYSELSAITKCLVR